MGRIVAIVLLLTNLVFNQGLGNRLKVPIYFTASLSTGHDSNFLGFSQVEKDRTANQPELLGDSETFDSAILRPQFRVVYSPVLNLDHPTNLIFSATHSEYLQSETKSYRSFFLRLEQHLGPYSWMKLYYSQIPEYFLRYYPDQDFPGSERQACSFASETMYLSYSTRVMSRTWLRVKMTQGALYYDNPFTEYDTELVSGEIRLITDRLPSVRISTWAVVGGGDNVSYEDGYFSTRQDRSYDFYQFGSAIRYDWNEWIDRIGLEVKGDVRTYLAENENDPLHSGREHLDMHLSLWGQKQLTHQLTMELRWNYREKTTVSTYDWVEDLKSYSKNQVWMKFSYDFHADLFY